MPSQPPDVAVVDDDASVRRGLVRFLRTSGCRVESFGSAEAFLDAYERGEERVLLLDVHMEGMSGPELLSRLRASGDNTPAVFLTAQEDAVGAAVPPIPGVPCVPKPFDAAHLLAVVREQALLGRLLKSNTPLEKDRNADYDRD